MNQFLSIFLPLLLISFGLHVRGQSAGGGANQTRIAVRATVGKIYVTNGQVWGSWSSQQMCPTGTYATGFSLKVQSYQGLGPDDSALNGIALRCTPPRTTTSPITGYSTINSATGSFGSWMPDRWCPSGQLVAFQLRVQAYQGIFWDDTAANNIRFKCTDGSVVEGDGTPWGEWGSWSQNCAGKGICGIYTSVEPFGWSWDYTALNDVQFFCCD
ncbi:vitelline membrane outer layer protein 1-like [Colossoma macropomum]|uniref:vitelline membrane outer layer protein 1-like n=1 Tax=Colossoma macropomum TaxID=42526 RepID=UPI001863C2E6|nr:vitelline membrane outer layer protein 1-like [Colossoma macropomum]XP_036444608.1 vitelline membrane outer layer protein 1-like [Colossoma macropomum]